MNELEILLRILVKDIHEFVQFFTKVAVDLEIVLLYMFFHPSSLKQVLHCVYEALIFDFVPGFFGQLCEVAALLVLH